MQLLHGDCLELLPNIPDSSVDLILTDIPFGTTKCKWDIIIPFDRMWNELHRIVKDTTAILLFGVEPFSSSLRLSNIKNYRYDWQWNKKRAANFLSMNKQPGKIIENISVFYRKQPMYNPQKIINPKGTQCKYSKIKPSVVSENVKNIMGAAWAPPTWGWKPGQDYEADKLLPNSLLEYVKDGLGKRLHPTQKPVALLEYLIRTYTNEENIVLDFTMGSGSTGVACKNLNRDFIGMELDKAYYDIACKRIEEA